MQPDSLAVTQSTLAPPEGMAPDGGYDFHFDDRLLPAGWKDAAVFAAGLYGWMLISAIVALAGPAMLIGGFTSLVSGFQSVDEISRFADDAFNEWLGLACLLILGYWVVWWARGIKQVAIGTGGMQLTRHIGRAVVLPWDDVVDIKAKSFAANSLSVLGNCRIATAFGKYNFAPADLAAFQVALARLRPTAPQQTPLTWTRRGTKIALAVLRGVVLCVCVSLFIVFLLAAAKFVVEPADAGSGYLSRPLQYLFMLKPSAAQPDAQPALLKNGVKSGNPAMVREALGRSGHLRESEVNLVELAVWGRASVEAGKAAPPYDADEEQARVEILRMLISAGAHVDPGALLAAALSGNAQIFTALRAAGAPLDDSSAGGLPDVALAARESIPALTLYLDAKADPNQPDDTGNTPLMIVASSTKGYDHKRLAMELLVARGARVDAQNAYGATLAHALALGGDSKLFTEWIARAGGNAARSKTGETLIHTAARGEKTQLIQQLIIDGANLAAVTLKGETPLHLARAPAMVTFLVGKGADVNAPDNEGKTPLHRAVIERRWEAVPVLIKSGARPYARDKAEAGGKTALDYLQEQLSDMPKLPRNRDELVKLLTP